MINTRIKEIKYSTHKQPHKYTILIPKNLNSILTKINSLKDVKTMLSKNYKYGSNPDSFSLNDFYIYQLVCNPSNTDFVKYKTDIPFLSKEDLLNLYSLSNEVALGEEYKSLQLIVSHLIQNIDYTKTYQQYKYGVINSINSTYIERSDKYNNTLGIYKLYKMKEDIFHYNNKTSLIMFGLDKILESLSKKYKKIYDVIVKNVRHKYLIGDAIDFEYQIEEYNKFYNLSDFLFLYEQSKGKHLPLQLIDFHFPFLTKFRNEDIIKYDTIKYVKTLVDRGNKFKHTFIRNVPASFISVNSSSVTFLKSKTAKYVVQDPKNFFKYNLPNINLNDVYKNLSSNPEVLDKYAFDLDLQDVKERAEFRKRVNHLLHSEINKLEINAFKKISDNLAMKVQDFVNIYGLNEKTRCYTFNIEKINIKLKELLKIKDSSMYNSYLFSKKLYIGEEGDTIKKLSLEEMDIFKSNNIRGLKIDTIKQAVVIDKQDKIMKLELEKDMNLKKKYLTKEIKTILDEIKILCNEITNIDIKYGFTECTYSISKIVHNTALAYYQPKDTKLEKDIMLETLEDEAFMGGIIDTYVQGKIEEPLITLDVNSMYPWIMSKHPMPISVKETCFNAYGTPLNDLLELSRDTQCCIAQVHVNVPTNIGISPIPCKIKNKNIDAILEKKDAYIEELEISTLNLAWDSITVFPVGEFDTTLCYHTLKLLQELIDKGYNIEVYIKNYIIYNSSNHLNKYSNYLFNLKQDIQDYEICDEVKGSVKLALVSSFGQFASHRFDEQGKRTNKFKDKAFPAIAAHITDAARVHMYKLMKIAKFENVYYINTDGIKVNFEGLSNLEQHNLVNYKTKPLGDLKIENIGQFIFSGKAGYEGYVYGTNFKVKLERSHPGAQDTNISNKYLQEYFDNRSRNAYSKAQSDYSSWYYQDTDLAQDKYNVNMFEANFLNYNIIDYINLENKYKSSVYKHSVEVLNHTTYNPRAEQKMAMIINHVRNECNYSADGLYKNNNNYGNIFDKYTEEIDIEI